MAPAMSEPFLCFRPRFARSNLLVVAIIQDVIVPSAE